VRFIKIVLSIVLMTFLASGTFSIVLAVAEGRGWGWIKFPQACAAGCLAAALVPLLIFARSRVLRERILTIVQTALILVTAGAACLVPAFVDHETLLFGLWFLSASIGITAVVALTYRLKWQNGERLSNEEIERFRAEHGQLSLLESYFEEELQRLRDGAVPDVARTIALGDMLRRIRSERLTLEAYLRERVSFHPPAVFGSDPPTSIWSPRDCRSD